jgi:hypothetical protein
MIMSKINKKYFYKNIMHSIIKQTLNKMRKMGR